jgi:starch phosphorylase
MRTVLDFRVEPAMPEKLLKLIEISYNLWWAWNPLAIDLFWHVDERLWEYTNHNPVQMLGLISQERLDKLAGDTGFLEMLDRVYQDLQLYKNSETWFSKHYGKTPAPFVAYFSMEFGLTECLPLYSGGLGVLSGDHMKSSSDLGIPLVGVTLLFQNGYFEQYLNQDGWQQEHYPINDFYTLPIRQVTREDRSPLRISVEFPGRKVNVQVWRCEIGRVTLFLLDTNLPENSSQDQNITNRLYGGDQELRIQQEIILGIGGIRALHTMGIQPLVVHINEGHAAFLVLERIRLLMAQTGLSYREARVLIEGGNVFTSHTPVPAGFDIFHEDLMRMVVASIPRGRGGQG